MTVAVWKDQRTMWVLYNHCSPLDASSLERWSDDGERVSVGCPRAIRDYFYGARSVDVLSQLHYAYAPGRKAMRSWPRLAWWLLDMCILNAFQLWAIGRDRPSQLDFREQLMHELMKQLPAERAPRKRGGGPHLAHALASEHYPERAGSERDCVECSSQPSYRAQSSFLCHACQVHLCIGACFSQHHA